MITRRGLNECVMVKKYRSLWQTTGAQGKGRDTAVACESYLALIFRVTRLALCGVCGHGHVILVLLLESGDDGEVT